MSEFKSRATQFKNIMGVHLLKPLFFEQTRDYSEKELALYTLKDQDHIVDGRVFPSIKRLYVEMEDTTEYEFANTYFDNYQHWKKLKASPWFKPIYEEMKEELALKLRHRYLSRVKELTSDEKLAMQANRYLLENDVVDKNVDKRGRPSKKAIEEEANKLFTDANAIDEDFDRLLKPNEVN